MSADPVAILRAIIREELAHSRPPELAIVTEAFAREGEDSDHNHEINLRLRASGLELQRVPVAVGRIGTSLLPRAGELVLVAFSGGRLNAPVVIGALYDERHRPPVAKPLEAVYQPPETADSSLRRLHVELPSGTKLTIGDDSLQLVSGGTEVVVDRDGDVTIRAAGKIAIEAEGDIALKAGGNLELAARRNVTVKGLAATLEGQAEAKVKASSVTLAGITQFSAS